MLVEQRLDLLEVLFVISLCREFGPVSQRSNGGIDERLIEESSAVVPPFGPGIGVVDV